MSRLAITHSEASPQQFESGNMHTRVLTHRIRGFGPAEGSLGNLAAAIKAGVRLVEVDTRHTADQRIVVHHSPCLGSITTGSGLIGELHSEEVFKQRFLRKPDECLAPLEAFLDVARHVGDLELWIDIKDYGLESKYIELVRDYGIQEKVRLISWIPETVVRLRQLDPAIGVGFSYSCLANRRTFCHLLRNTARLLKLQGRPLAKRCRRGAFADLLRTIPFVHPLSCQIGDRPDGSLGVGFNHAHLIPGLPDGLVLESDARD